MAAAAAALVSFSGVVCASCLEGSESPTTELRHPAEEATPTEPTGEAAESMLKVFCKKAEHGSACAAKCAAQGIGCVFGALHPRKPDEPLGLLYACNSLTPGFMCSYTYPNGDTCHFPFGRPGLALCVYAGGGE